MKIQELLAIVTSLANSAEAEETQNTELQPTDSELQPVELDVMVSPLQQELELLKKANKVDNVFDKPEEEELTIIKKNAGIPVQQIQRGEI